MITNLYRNFGSILEDYLSNNSEINLLISPFISLDAAKKLLRKSNNVLIITSWREDHLISGVSNIELYQLCKEKGWKLAINNRIHAKIYSSNFDSCFITSANCTNQALYNIEGNIECISFMEKLDQDSCIELNKIILESVVVTDEIYMKYKSWLDNKTVDDKEIPDEMPPVLDSSFYINQLPATDDPHLLCNQLKPFVNSELRKRIDHDLALFGSLENLSVEEHLEIISTNFFNSPFIIEIIQEINEDGLSFGNLSSIIHERCMDIPSPYRKEVKTFTHNVMSWLTALKPNEYYISISGRHSQVIFKK